MKTLKLLSLFLGFFMVSASVAQVSVNVKVGAAPPWGPAGYNGAQYYYLPDVESYYDVPSSMFIYNEGGIWVHRSNLPHRFRNYNLYGGYKVVMNDYHGNTPYSFYGEHKKKYGPGFHGPSQKTIGNRPGNPNNKAKAHKNGPAFKKNGSDNVKNKDASNHKPKLGNSKSNDKDNKHGHDKGNGRKSR